MNTANVNFVFISVMRPAPLSSVVNRTKRSRAVSHATLIQSVLEKVKEVQRPDTHPQSVLSPEATQR